MIGTHYLRISGIVMIALGALSAVWFSYVILSILFFESWNIFAVLHVGGYLPVACVQLLASVTGIVAGVFGVKYCDDFDKARSCIGLGVLWAILFLFGHILAVRGSYDSGWIFLLMQMLTLLFYMIGAAKNY